MKSAGVGIELFSFCKTNDDNYHCLLVTHARLRCLSFLKRNTSAIETQNLPHSLHDRHGEMQVLPVARSADL